MTSSTKVKQFYDNFTNSRMLEYKLYGNLRKIIDEVIEINSLIQLARQYEFNLEYFTYIDV
jgi:hypothetical protein